MKVYRLEWKDGNGIYHWSKGEDLRPYSGQTGNNKKHWPLPQDDVKLMYAIKKYFGHNDDIPSQFLAMEIFESSRFGFISIEQLQKWFYNRKMLDAADHMHGLVCEYDVPDEKVLVGDSQCLFEGQYHKPENKVASWPIHEFLNLYPMSK